jgi:hypothetical protein
MFSRYVDVLLAHRACHALLGEANAKLRDPAQTKAQRQSQR